MLINFYKYQGTGNDFIILDCREQELKLSEEQISFLCHRRFGIGADGLMIYLNREGFDFEMRYFNADGKEGSMCGNGGRCIIKFAHSTGLHKDIYHFFAVDGQHEAEVDINGWIRLKMNDVLHVKADGPDFILDTGSPHFVKFVNELKDYDVTDEGKEIRYNEDFEKDGINVNFVEIVNDHTIFVRTYERGVEAETWSCGTGVTASALVSAHNETGFNQVDVHTLGGKLSVEFERLNDSNYKNIWLCGPAQFVFEGKISL
jgi:diaminopimelate epimerase